MQSNNRTSTDTSVLRSFSLLCLAAVLAVKSFIAFFGMEFALKVASYSPLRCPLALLGWRCPTCGLGHSLFHALNGEWGMAHQWHPLGMVVLALALIFAFLSLLAPRTTLEWGRRVRALPLGVLGLALLFYVSWHFLRLSEFPKP